MRHPQTLLGIPDNGLGVCCAVSLVRLSHPSRLPPPTVLTVQTCKFKGLVNDGIQIKATFSEDGMFVVSGSEDGQVYITFTLENDT